MIRTRLAGYKALLIRMLGSSKDERGELQRAQKKLGLSVERIKRLQGRIEERDAENAQLRARLFQHDIAAGSDANGGADPKNIIWVFCTGRSGSTWLASMMSDLEGHYMWHEPQVGDLFGSFYYLRNTENHHKNWHSVLGRHRDVWLKSIRRFVLDGIEARFPELVGEHDRYLVIKEPHGSIGAPLMMEALPESRMVLLVRDPRDVVASALDGNKKGSWQDVRGRGATAAEERPDNFVRRRAHTYVEDIGNARVAYEAHGGSKSMVRYEDLRADTLGEMRRVYSELGIPVDEGELARVVEKHAWENIPEEDKGEGKFYRKATPQGWREDLTPRQVEIVEEITAPLLREFYPA